MYCIYNCNIILLFLRHCRRLIFHLLFDIILMLEMICLKRKVTLQLSQLLRKMPDRLRRYRTTSHHIVLLGVEAHRSESMDKLSIALQLNLGTQRATQDLIFRRKKSEMKRDDLCDELMGISSRMFVKGSTAQCNCQLDQFAGYNAVNTITFNVVSAQ